MQLTQEGEVYKTKTMMRDLGLVKTSGESGKFEMRTKYFMFQNKDVTHKDQPLRNY